MAIVMEMHCVFCELVSEFLNSVLCQLSSLQIILA